MYREAVVNFLLAYIFTSYQGNLLINLLIKVSVSKGLNSLLLVKQSVHSKFTFLVGLV